MALTLPYPDMNFVPLDVLTAAEQNQLVANIEYIANNVESVTGIYATGRTRIYIDGTAGDDNNDGLSSSTPKKTLTGVMAKINEIGGSANIRFMSAGTYDFEGGFLDSANFAFGKNSSSIGDVTVNIITRNLNVENSVLTLDAISLTGAGANISLVNSYLSVQSSSLSAQVNGIGSCFAIYGVDITNKISATYGTTARIFNSSITPQSGLTSGNMVAASDCSNIYVGNLTINSPAEPTNTMNLFSISDGSDFIFHHGSSITNNAASGTKYGNRAILGNRAIIQALETELSAIDPAGANAISIGNASLKIVGNATIGA